MGNSESSAVDFRKLVIEQTNNDGDVDWEKLLPFNTAKDLFAVLTANEIRMLRDTNPNALASLCYKAIRTLRELAEKIPAQAEHRKILNCIRLLTRLIPFLFEENEWRSYFWTQLPAKDCKGGEAQIPVASSLLGTLSDLLFCPNFTIGPLDKNTHIQSLSKIDSCEHIWQAGVGYAGKPPVSAVYDANRTEILKLLLVCFSEIIFTQEPDTTRMRWVARFTSAENRNVLPLFTSLLNTVCSYDPIGMGLPYNYLLVGDSAEPLVEAALQVLIVCLDRESQPNNEESGYTENYFVNYLSRIHREEDFDFMLKKFLYYVLKTSDVLDILVPILYHLNDARTDPSRIGLIHMGVFLILLLSGERNFGVRLNKPFTSRGLIDVPIFTGTHADLLIIVFHKLITSGNHKLQSLFDCLLTIIVNVSPYLKSLSMVTANKLVHLVEAFSTPWFIFSSPTNHHLIFFLLELFNNIIQYQFDGNSNLIYTIIRKRQVFYQLSNLQTDSISIAQGMKKGKKAKEAGENPAAESENKEEKVEEQSEKLAEPNKEATAGLHSTLAQTPAIAAMTTNWETTEAGAKDGGAQPQSQEGQKEGEEKSAAAEDEWVPTPEWVESWKSKLPLQTIMRVLQILVPQVEKICIDKGLTDESEILKFLQHGTLVGLLPVPHPILIRKYIANAATNNWFRTYMWGVIYLRNIEPPIWYDSEVNLFEIQKV